MLKKLVVALTLVMPAMAMAQGPYFTMGAAFGNVDLGEIDAGATSSDDELQRIVIGGGVKLNPMLSLEALYLSNVENDIEFGLGDATLDHSGVQLAVLAAAPLTSQLSLFGKISGNYLNVEYEDALGSLDDTGMHLGVGAGLSFQATDQVGLRATFERLMVTDVGGSDGDFDVDQIALSLNYSF